MFKSNNGPKLHESIYYLTISSKKDCSQICPLQLLKIQ